MDKNQLIKNYLEHANFDTETPNKVMLDNPELFDHKKFNYSKFSNLLEIGVHPVEWFLKGLEV